MSAAKSKAERQAAELLERRWREKVLEVPPMSCGRLDMHTKLIEPVRVLRTTSDRVRCIYFEGEHAEVVCLGERADFVAYAAARYVEAELERERLERRIAELEAQLEGRAKP